MAYIINEKKAVALCNSVLVRSGTREMMDEACLCCVVFWEAQTDVYSWQVFVGVTRPVSTVSEVRELGAK